MWIIVKSLLASRTTWYVLAAVAIAGIIWVQTHRLHAAQDAEAAAKQELAIQIDQTKAAIAANATNQTTIDTLQAQLKSMIDERRADADKAAALLAQREDQLANAVKTAALERKKRSEVWNASQSCQALAATRVDTVCGPIADRLRERTAAHGDVNPNG